MRKIEANMLRAIAGGYDWRGSNTAVIRTPQGWEVRLHGNCIAKLDTSEDAAVQFNLCGWNTPTTRSRINAIAGWCGRQRVTSRRHAPGMLVDGKWTELPTTLWF